MARPRRFTNIQDLEKELATFFVDHRLNDTMPTKGNMALHLGVDRDTVNEYRKGTYDDPDNLFSVAIKEADELIENEWVQNLTENAAAGTIFYLKNAFGYRDKKETDLTSGGKPLAVPDSLYAKYSPDASTGGNSEGQPQV